MSKTKFRFRILPVFIFMAVLTLSVRVGNLFESLVMPEQSKISVAPRQAVAQEKETIAANVAVEQEPAQKPNSLNQVLEEQYSGMTLETASSRLASESEIAILRDLAERREMLDLKGKEIEKRSVQLKVIESEIAKKVEQLKTYEGKLKRMIGEYNAKEKEKLNALVKMYASMKPKDAARIFNTLDIDVVVPILEGMKPSSSSAILSQMNAEKAKVITSELMGGSL